MKLRPLSFRELVKILNRLGFVVVRQRGSHVVLKGVHKEMKRTVVVPRHSEIAVGTLRGILLQAGLDIEELLELVEKD